MKIPNQTRDWNFQISLSLLILAAAHLLFIEFLVNSDRDFSSINYQIHLNRAIEIVKKRDDLIYAAMKGQALMTIESYEMNLSLVPQAVSDIGGKMFLTIMPFADDYSAPADDTRAR